MRRRVVGEVGTNSRRDERAMIEVLGAHRASMCGCMVSIVHK